MFSEYDSTSFFIDLLALSILLLPAYVLMPSALGKRILLILAGAYLLYFIAPRLVLFYLVSWSFVFILQRIVAFSTERKGGTAIFWVCIVLTLAPMVIWKLWFEDFSIAFNLWGNNAVGLLSYRVWEIDLARKVIIPIGLSFATFRALDLLVKTFIGKFEALSFDRVLFYGFFPSVQVVGPIIEYEEIQKQGDHFQKPTAADIYTGSLRIIFGLIKVLIITGVLQKSAVVFQTYETASFYNIWIYLFVYTWYFYLNFSGYSDLAIGISRLFGFRLKENFNYPYFQKNIADFWNNWHMSLSHFAQRNAFVPIGGYRKRTQFLAIYATIMVIALWHDVSLGMVIFGTYHGLGLIVHRIAADRAGKKTGPEHPFSAWGKIVGTYIFVTLSFPLLALPLEKASWFYLALLGM